MKFLTAAVCLLVMFACNQNQENNSTPPANKDSADRSSKSPERVIKSFTLLQIDRNTLPVKDSITGKIVDAASWADADGENIVVLSESDNTMTKEGTQNKRIYASCFIKDNNGWKKKWQVQDYIEKCEVDATCEFFQSSLTVTDVDKNNTGEVCFLYKLSCKGDVSPDDKKLILYEGSQKYAIRGTTILQYNGQKEGGAKKADPAFSNADKSLLDFANGQWEKFGLQKY